MIGGQGLLRHFRSRSPVSRVAIGDFAGDRGLGTLSS